MVAVVIPAFNVKKHILQLINEIGNIVEKIIVVDDKCPQKTGKYVLENCHDLRVEVIFNEKNKGVGGAVISGYQKALGLGAEIVIKLDGDGQMDPKLIPGFVKLIQLGKGDYVKGNRFFNVDSLESMPSIRLFGNSVLSFVIKIVSGYWNIMDPTNGFIAIHSTALKRLPLNKISKRYFFESDMLFQLNIARAVVVEFPMEAKYADEEIGLRIYQWFTLRTSHEG